MTLNLDMDTDYQKVFDFDLEETAKKVIEGSLDHENCPYEAEVNLVLTDNEEIIRMGVTILVVDVMVEIGRAVNIYATNALRSAGDVNYPFYVGLIVQWTVSVGLSYFLGIYLGWGLVGMWCAFLLDENIRAFIFVKRWNSLKWAKKGFVR